MLFREVNDRIFELLSSGEPDLPGEFFCECGKDCGRRVELSPDAYAELKRAGLSVRSDECGRRGVLRLRRRAAVSSSVPALG
ncbi:MAG TPA: hypothetical protein VKR79_09330 [Gaiellaceae bacterium]|nr:hypothetical protein [Gaiellaceae bacterium]